MAIQLPNAGLGDGKTGDNEFVMWTKVKDNFSNTAHAASKLIGAGNNDISLNKDITATGYSNVVSSAEGTPPKDLPYGRAIVGSEDIVDDDGLFALTGHSSWVISTIRGKSTLEGGFQIAWPSNSHGSLAYDNATPVFCRHMSRYRATFGKWIPIGQTDTTYSVTSASGANVVVNAAGQLMRAASSEKYKNILSDLILDDETYKRAMEVSPIVYRSKSENDPKDWHYMSFSAEELGGFDPSLTQWLLKTHDDEGNELDEPVKEAEGINLNAICAVLHATNIYQDKKIKELEQRLTALETNNEPIE